MDVRKTFKDNFYRVKNLEKIETVEWKIVIAKPSKCVCQEGACVLGMTEMIEREDKYNVISVDTSACCEIKFTFREEKPTKEITVNYIPEHKKKEKVSDSPFHHA